MEASLKEISSYDEMVKNFSDRNKNYVLLYKKGSETSDCSYRKIKKVVNQLRDINIVAADVNSVRDIHLKYRVTSAPSLLVFEGKKFIKIVKGCNDEKYYKSLFQRVLYIAPTVDNEAQPQKRVIVYSTPSCSWCNTLKTHLRKNGIRFTDVDVSRDRKAAETMVASSGQQGVPQIDINGEIIVGFDKKRINNFLKIK